MCAGVGRGLCVCRCRKGFVCVHVIVHYLLPPATSPTCTLLKVALADIQSNPSFANVLPDVAQYMSEAVS